MTTANEIINKMQEEFNKFISNEFSVVKDDEYEPIPTGIKSIDLLLGGGIGKGFIVQITGDPSAFKSTLATNIAGNIKRNYEKSIVVYLDAERSMTIKRLQDLGLHGVNPVVGLTLEKVFKIIEATAVFKKQNKIDDPAVIIWDSLAMTPCEAELTAEDPHKVLGLKSRMLSWKMPGLKDIVSDAGITLIIINQTREKINMDYGFVTPDLKHMGTKVDIPGGKILKFCTDQMLYLRQSTSYEPEVSPYGFRAAIVTAKTIKNKLFPDGYSYQYVVNVATGYDDLYTWFDLMKKHKKVKAGAWNALVGYEKRFRTKELHEVYNEDSAFREAFDNAVSELYKELQNKMASYEATSEKIQEHKTYDVLDNEPQKEEVACGENNEQQGESIVESEQ